MSTLHPGLAITTLFSYMEKLARQILAIGHSEQRPRFARMTGKEAPQLFRTALTGTALCVEYASASGVDESSNNLLVERIVAFTVATPEPDTNNAVVEALKQCEDIALQVLARMRHDRLAKDPALRVFADVKMGQWIGEPVEQLFNGKWIGYRIEIPVQNTDLRLIYDPTQWNTDL